MPATIANGGQYGTDPDYCCVAALVWWRRWIFWPQTRLLVTIAASQRSCKNQVFVPFPAALL